MEKELKMTTCLFGGPPVLDDLVKLGNSQTGFMNIFAGPLFEAMSVSFPNMRFAVDEIATNKQTWERVIESEQKQVAHNFITGVELNEKLKLHSDQKSEIAPHAHHQQSKNSRPEPLKLAQSRPANSSNREQNQEASTKISGPYESDAASAPSSRRASLGPTVLPSASQSSATSSSRKSSSASRHQIFRRVLGSSRSRQNPNLLHSGSSQSTSSSYPKGSTQDSGGLSSPGSLLEEEDELSPEDGNSAFSSSYASNVHRERSLSGRGPVVASAVDLRSPRRKKASDHDGSGAGGARNDTPTTGSTRDSSKSSTTGKKLARKLSMVFRRS